ncbi:hypothetical protein [Streptomyces albogriseolus]|uniref:hypothetical protein n=1 Tax=Streptomyces albogriseolus TaxID=1887 RepID=UPI00225935BA|nr:hypothetical protein [Streptomyces viridodiastaticus]MCX4624390.1 hypothetical protein [Streptomyces viridodiastaticus]
MDLTEPAVDVGLLNAVTEVADDLFQTSPLLQVDAEDRTPDAPLTERSLEIAQFSGRME